VQALEPLSPQQLPRKAFLSLQRHPIPLSPLLRLHLVLVIETSETILCRSQSIKVET
jgi:hypothetical protein